MSLRVRVGAVAGLAVAVTVLTAAVVVYFAVRSNLRGEVDRALVERAGALVGAVPEGGRGPGPGRGGPGAGRFGPPGARGRFGGAEGYVQIVGAAGGVTRPPGAVGSLPVTDRAAAIASRGDGQRFEDVDAAGVHVRVLTVGLGGIGAAQVARPLTEVDSVLDRVLAVLIVVGLAGIALAAALGAGVARLALAPIADFTRRTEEIAARPDLSERIDLEGRDELARLAQSFNATLSALEQAVEAQRALVADAGHELRTPIASLRANIQTLEHADRLAPAELAALRADVISELDELTGLVADIVELARGARVAAELDDVRLDELVRSILERFQRRGNGQVSYRGSLEPALIRAEPERVSRAVSNLLDNARKWSPPGGTVDVDLAGGVLSVRDHGPGFHPDDIPHVFDRFYRAAAARGTSGSGLGLAIVSQAAEAHGGWARAENAPGGGAIVRVRFDADSSA